MFFPNTVAKGRRQWRDLDFVGLWSTVFLTIYGWQATASLLSFGLNVWQAVLCTIIARVLQYFIVLSLGWLVQIFATCLATTPCAVC